MPPVAALTSMTLHQGMDCSVTVERKEPPVGTVRRLAETRESAPADISRPQASV